LTVDNRHSKPSDAFKLNGCLKRQRTVIERSIMTRGWRR